MPYLAGYVTPQDYGAVGNGTADDTAAINQALAAVASNGSTILFPSGYSYRITSTLAPSVNGTILAGTGWGSQILYDGSVATTAIAPTGNIRCFLRDIRISQSNASHVGTALDWSGANTSTIERVLIDGGGASGVSPLTGIKMNASTCHYNVVRDCRVGYGGASSTGISIIGSSHSNTVDNTRCVPQADDVNSSGIYIANTHSTTLIRPDIESAAGNGIWLDTAANATRILNGYCDSNNINLKITSGVVAPTVDGTFQGGVTANVQDNGSLSPSIVNAWPNSGSNSYSSVALTNVNAYTLNGVQVPGNVFQASDHNLIAWSYDPALPTNSLALSTGGVVHLVKVILRYAATINNVLYQVNTAGATLTSGQNFVGVYDSGGTRRAVSADQTTAWGSTGLMTTAMTASYSAAAGVYYIAFVANGTTGPALARLNGLAGAGATINAGLTAATYRFATNGSGNTSLPASLTLSSNSTESVPYWAALS
jgi:hypothetical protein